MLIQFQQKHKHIVQGAAETALECSACALLLLKDTELQTSSYKYISHTHSRSKKNISLFWLNVFLLFASYKLQRMDFKCEHS